MTAIERVGIVLLFVAVVFGGWRTASGFMKKSPAPPSVTEYAPGSLPGAEVLASAIRTDLLAEELRSKPPSRSPFRAVARASAPAKEVRKTPAWKPPSRAKASPGVPRVVLVIRDATGPRVVLALGEVKSGPLRAGEDFSNWKVREVGLEKVYLEKNGIRLTLPIP